MTLPELDLYWNTNIDHWQKILNSDGFWCQSIRGRITQNNCIVFVAENVSVNNTVTLWQRTDCQPDLTSKPASAMLCKQDNQLAELPQTQHVHFNLSDGTNPLIARSLELQSFVKFLPSEGQLSEWSTTVIFSVKINLKINLRQSTANRHILSKITQHITSQNSPSLPPARLMVSSCKMFLH